MATAYQNKRSTVPGNTPTTSDIAPGQIAINLADKSIWTSNGTGTFIIAGNNSPISGANTQVIFNDSGTSNGVAGLTFNKTTNTFSVGNSLTANTTTIVIQTSAGLMANGSIGTSGQVLTSNGTTAHWATPSGSSGSTFNTVVDTFVANGTANTFGLSVNSTSNNSYVYINGIEQDSGNSYTISANVITFSFNVTANSTVTVKTPTISNVSLTTFTTVIGSSDIVFGSNNGMYTNKANTTANTGVNAIDSFSSTTFRSANYFIQVTDNGANNYHSTQITLIHDGTTVFVNEFGTIYSNTHMGTFNADIVSSQVRLLYTPTNANTTVRVMRTLLGV